MASMKSISGLLSIALWACILPPLIIALPSGPLPRSDSDNHWITVWTAMPQLTEPANLPSGVFNNTLKFQDTTIRQTLKFDLPAGCQTTCNLRLRFSNAFGTTHLNISSVTIARPFNNSAGTSSIQEGTLQTVTFNKTENEGVSVPPGSLAVSDPFPYDFTGITTYASNGTTEAGSIVTVTMYLAGGQEGEAITSHPGSRTDTYLSHGNQVTVANITGDDVQSLAHWYFVSAVEAWAPTSASTLVIVGDSITDGRGSDTNLNDRWPDLLFTQLQSSSATSGISIANQAAGGNRILQDGLGPSALSRIDRDVLAQSGVQYAMIFEGVNDIGTAAANPAAQDEVYASLIAAYRQMILRLHAQGIPVFGATITPFGSLNSTLQPYSDPAGYREQTRSKVNNWIRSSGAFDAVVDFDAVVRDMENATMLASQYDSSDHLHPNVAGYHAMADTFPIGLFAQWAGGVNTMT